MAVVIVRSTAPRGHFRVGRKFHRDADAYELSDAEIVIVRADPRLVIEGEPKRTAVSSLPAAVANTEPAKGQKLKG